MATRAELEARKTQLKAAYDAVCQNQEYQVGNIRYSRAKFNELKDELNAVETRLANLSTGSVVGAKFLPLRGS